MHELPVMEKILAIALKHADAHGVKRIMAIHLRVGELTDLVDEWMQRYFDYISRDTLAEGALLKIRRVPVVLKCGACEETFTASLRTPERICCPACQGQKVTLISGREFHVENLEVI